MFEFSKVGSNFKKIKNHSIYQIVCEDYIVSTYNVSSCGNYKLTEIKHRKLLPFAGHV